MKGPFPDRPPDGDFTEEATVPEVDTKAFSKWLASRSAEDIRRLDMLVYQEGLRRGFGAYWNE